MAWCPNCGGEYIDGIATCNKCNVDLVEEPVEISTEETASKQSKKPYEKEVFLVNVGSVVELAYITSMLDENHIGYRVSEVSSGSYLTVLHGKSFFGKNIYVGQSSFDDAMWIIESYDADIEMEAELDIPKEQMISTKGKIYMGGFLIFVVVIIILI